MTKYIDKYYLNGTEYKIKFAGGGGGWQPDPTRTIFYYKFNNNLDDEMGNHNLTEGSGSQTITYGTTSGGATYAYFSKNCWSSQSGDISGTWSDEHTMSFWVNAQGIGQGILLDMGYRGGYVWTRPNSNIEIGYFDLQTTPFYDIGTGTWYHIVVVRNNTYSKFYVNGNLEATGTPWTITTSAFRLTINNAWDTSSSSYSNNAYLSELIFEKGAWTDQEITAYFNSTKSLYGIS